MAGNPNIKVYFENSVGEVLGNKGSRIFNSIVKNAEIQFKIYIENSGDTGTTLVIPRSGISLITNSSGFLVNSPTLNSSIGIFYGDSGSYVSVLINSSSIGSKFITISIESNDPNIDKFEYTFYFEIIGVDTSGAIDSSDISVVYNGLLYPLNGTINLGFIPEFSTMDIPFQIFNYGTGSLVIPQNGITITVFGNNESLILDPSSTEEISISYNLFSTFKVRIDTSSLGLKSFIITIVSNDSLKTPFIITVNYIVASTFDLFVKESSEEVIDQEVLSLGSFDKKSIINRNISLSNKGISYGIRLLSFISDGDITLSGIPSLPFVLQPNEKNSLQIVAKLGSTVLGKRNASLGFQWEVSA